MPSALNPASESSLDELGRKHNCDKSSVNRKQGESSSVSFGHDYLRHYEIYLRGYTKDTGFSMLELGAGPDWNIGASLKIWKEYFPLANKIVVADDKESAQELEALGTNIKVVTGDLGNSKTLSLLEGSYDFIIDDASHIWRHQIECFNVLFQSLNPGGLYIIEDIQTSFGKGRSQYSGGANNPDKLDAYTYFLLMSAYKTGDFTYHPVCDKIFDAIGSGVYDKRTIDLLAEKCKSIASKVASVTFIRHSCIITKDYM